MAELIVAGPRKRKQTRRVTDNADPLLRSKKARLAPKTTIHAPENMATKSNALDHHLSVEIEEVDDEETGTIQQASLKDPKHIIEVDSTGDEEESAKGEPTNDDGEDEDPEFESADDELHESKVKLNQLFSNSRKCRTFNKTVEHTCLCFLQANSHCRPH